MHQQQKKFFKSKETKRLILTYDCLGKELQTVQQLLCNEICNWTSKGIFLAFTNLQLPKNVKITDADEFAIKVRYTAYYFTPVTGMILEANVVFCTQTIASGNVFDYFPATINIKEKVEEKKKIKFVVKHIKTENCIHFFGEEYPQHLNQETFQLCTLSQIDRYIFASLALVFISNYLIIQYENSFLKLSIQVILYYFQLELK